MSLPAVVIVHGNQEPQSWATITWDNAFSEVSRIPFAVVDRVPWQRMANALNMKFTCQTGRSLTNDNLYYLCKLTVCSIMYSNFYRPLIIPRNSFVLQVKRPIAPPSISILTNVQSPGLNFARNHYPIAHSHSGIGSMLSWSWHAISCVVHGQKVSLLVSSISVKLKRCSSNVHRAHFCSDSLTAK